MKDPRWTAISESNFAWEKEALDWLRNLLPDRDPWHVWSNFEFIDDEGKVNEVDALVLSPVGIFLVEVKSRPGILTGDAHTWTWRTDGRDYAYDNPLILANRKAKRLATLLRRQTSVIKAKSRVPFIEPLIFLSAINADSLKLAGNGRSGVFLKGRPDSSNDDGIIARLEGTGNYPPSGPLLSHELGRIVCRAVIEAGVRPSNKHRRIGDYQLGALIQEGENYQDWEGEHVSAGVRRRVRIYGYALASTVDARQSLVRQATREFQILEGIEHPGILRVRDFKESELGPALVFDFNPQSRRLDFLLREQGGQLNVDQRLSILRQLAETLKYAHQKKLIHRALSPQSILVQNQDGSNLKLAIMNWQLAARGGQSLGQTNLTVQGISGGTLVRTVGTQHVEEYVDDPAKIFIAPEALWDGAPSGPHLDVFSLGVIAWQIFTGEPPAANAHELQQKLKAGNGLRISDVLDGAGKALQDLIQFSTCPDVSARLGSMADFLEYLELVEDELTAPAELATVDPASAKSGDLIDGGFTVVRRLGKGSSSDVLLVTRAGSEEELVLKVALDASHSTRLTAEGETIKKLRHANIVEWQQTLVVAGRTALLMKSAGKDTLAYHLANNRPSLDLVRRFGEELLQTVVYLEDQGVYHRDIKPDNIGLCPSSHSGRLQLVLFDFSLSRASVDNIQAGTRPYLDPFLSLRKPPRWDIYAERFALAMTLYEMVTGTLPIWGDGVSDPALIDDEVTLDVTLFDPNLREGLTAFFGKALRREFHERFDNAEDMLRDWRKVFDQVEVRTTADPFEVIARRATREMAIGELGYSVEAQNVLDRMGIHSVRELLAVDRVRFRYLKSVGDKVRKEIRGTAKRLAQLRPDLVAGAPTVLDVDAGKSGIRSVDELANHLFPKRAAADDRPDDDALAIYLGLEAQEAGQGGTTTTTLWPSLGDAAQAAGVSRPALTNALVAARARWLKSTAITEVREDLAVTLNASGGVVSVAEAATSLLASRGSIEQDDAARLRLAAAVLRAVIEAEADLAEPRYQIFPGATNRSVPLIAATIDHADYALRLGQAADVVVETDDATASGASLPTPQQAIEALDAVDRPHTVPPMSAQRQLKLAAGCSQRAAVSSRLELYPLGMAAQRAIRIAMGSLIGPRVLTEAQVRERILGRYPDAEDLPARPTLDGMLTEAGSDLVWRKDGEDGAGYYPSHKGFGPSAGTTTFLHRPGTAADDQTELTEEQAAARQFDDKLSHGLKAGGFLALTVAPRLARHAEAALQRRIASADFLAINLDQLILESLKEEAVQRKVAWNKVVEADIGGPGTRDWTNVIRLASLAKGRIKAKLTTQRKSLLLVNPGLLARLDLMDLISDLQNLAGSATGVPSVWMLAPMNGQGMPTLDGVAIPVITQAQWARVPDAWVGSTKNSGVGA
jgi:serine/threonine protein kinase